MVEHPHTFGARCETCDRQVEFRYLEEREQWAQRHAQVTGHRVTEQTRYCICGWKVGCDEPHSHEQRMDEARIGAAEAAFEAHRDAVTG